MNDSTRPKINLREAITAAWPDTPIDQWHALGTALLHGLQAAGVGDSRLCGDLGLSTNSVYQMTSEDFGKLFTWAEQNYPDVVRELLEENSWAARALQR